MNKAELIVAIAEKADMRRVDIDKVLTIFTQTIVETLEKGEKVTLAGFGIFDVKNRPEKTAINPATKAKITVPACKVPGFKMSKTIKEALNK